MPSSARAAACAPDAGRRARTQVRGCLRGAGWYADVSGRIRADGRSGNAVCTSGWPTLHYENLFDILVLLLLAAAFIIGYLQGTVRRLLGVTSIIFSLIVASHLRDPIGSFLAENWVTLPSEYSRMIAFAFAFTVVVVAFSIVIQAVYERSRIVPRFPALDPLVGGVLGMVEAGVLIGAGVLILDSYFRTTGVILSPAEFISLRDLDHAVDVSLTAKILRNDLIPAFFFLLGGFIPEEIRRLFPG